MEEKELTWEMLPASPKQLIVELWLKDTAEPRIYSADNTYQEGDMFCILKYQDDGRVKIYKYPMSTIFRVVSIS